MGTVLVLLVQLVIYHVKNREVAGHGRWGRKKLHTARTNSLIHYWRDGHLGCGVENAQFSRRRRRPRMWC
jgi:hypothetical protein